MKRLPVLFIALGLLTSACSKDSPTAPTAPTNPVFTVDMRPANEVPPVTNAESSGTGTMTITFNLTRDGSNNVTAATATFIGTFSNFPAGTTLTAAHIHPGATGVNGSPLVNLALTQGQISFANGSGTLSVSNITMTPEVAQQIAANPAGYYFNIHTAQNTGGVARGQLVRTQ